MDARNQLLRRLPAVDAVMARQDVQALLAEQPRNLVLGGARRAIADRRAALLAGRSQRTDIGAADVQTAIDRWTRPRLRTVINASGVMLHTNLGRAPLPPEVLERMARVCTSYSNLELDLASGRRGQRMALVRDILCELTGAEAALVVNNNAGAVYLGLRALAAGRQVLVSRGELVEIGGSFRVPDVMAASGAELCEVGTTNRTRLADYERAIGPETGLILKVNRSNFALVGFTEETPVEQLAELARRAGLPLMLDMGSACLLERPPAQMHGYRPRAALEAGADLVCFSGDKLLGGPQAGVVLGAERLVAQLARDPMARALRVDKMTLAALEACLAVYRGGDEAARVLPVVAMMLAEPDALRRRAERLRAALAERLPDWSLAVEASEAQVGGGSLPLLAWPSSAVALQPPAGGCAALAERLRSGEPAVLGRLQHERLLLDVRCLLGDEQLEALADAVARAAAAAAG